MSGPITRQYGVPNWDDIFGKKEEQPANSPQPPNSPENLGEARPAPPPLASEKSMDGDR